MTRCVVIVPGIMGSVLKLGREVIWPGRVLHAFVTRYDRLPQLLDDAVEPAGLVRKVFVFSQYEDLLRDLARLGFVEGETLLECPYDWRRGCELAAGRLADLLDAMVAARPDAKATLVAHSMGGLVSRYYLESGEFATRPGFAAVTRLVTLGTPHFGAPKALAAILGLERMAFLQPDQVATLANDPRFTSTYQLLPQHGHPFAWSLDPSCLYEPVDVWQPATARTLNLSAAGMEAARCFHERLDPARAPVPYFCFVGGHHATMSLVHVDPGGSGSAARLRPITSDDSGDGTVPVWSAGLPRVQALPVGGEHSTIFRSRELRHVLAALLGRPGALPQRTAASIEVSVRDKVVAPGERVRGALAFTPRASLRGVLRVEVANATGSHFARAGPDRAVRYHGVAAERIGFALDAPRQPGAYRVRFLAHGASRAAGGDDFFVQANGS